MRRIENMLAIITKNGSIFIFPLFIHNKMIALQLYHLMTIKTFSCWLFRIIYFFLSNPFFYSTFGLKIGANVLSLKIFILHNKFTGWPKKSSFKLVNVMIKFICFLSYLRNIRSIDTKLSLTDYNITVSKIYHQISVWSFKPVLYSYNLKFFTRSCDFSLLHFLQKLANFLTCGFFGFTP